ncbi:hypothetical protein RB195_024254 [Necator americanus]|uniref:Uncharacterized protein n=1 Tax=Necator americanus TaxID=51031 RepID=A0ABR1EMG8_NECAM
MPLCPTFIDLKKPFDSVETEAVEHRECSEKDQKHAALCSPLQHHSTFCFDPSSRNLALCQLQENAVNITERSIKIVMLGLSRFTQMRGSIRSSVQRQRSRIRDAAAFAKYSKIRWTDALQRQPLE